MVLIDTNVWIGLYRRRTPNLGEAVRALTERKQACICGQIFVEFIGGFRDKTQRDDNARSFAKFPLLPTGPKEYELAAELLGEYPRLKSGDAMIAATAINSKASLLTLDGDFKVMVNTGLALFDLKDWLGT